jgi:enamine deaminase RidA (YjgF/YER057c/UK114 family)
MTIRRISSGEPFEEQAGYCRAVVAGGFVHVAGTVAGGPDVPVGAAAQCASALKIIENALGEAGVGFEDVVRVTYLLPDRSDFETCRALLKATFGDNPPAATMIVCGLIEPKYRIEIEVTALLAD